jgi:hypothetical protein
LPHPLHGAFDAHYVVLLAFVLLATLLAYQSPPAVDIAVGSLGDRLFLQSSAGLSEADAPYWYTDELTPEAASGRSRWTRQEATVHIPAFETTSDVSLMVRMRGWPSDVVRSDVAQPTVHLLVNGATTGIFTPTTVFDDYYVVVPAKVLQTGQLQIQLQVSDVFTATHTYTDMRLKGVRVERIAVATPNDWIAWTTPLWIVVGQLAVIGTLIYLTMLMYSRRQVFSLVVTLIGMFALALAIAFQRVYTVAVVPTVLLVCGVAFVVAIWRDIARYGARFARRMARGGGLGLGLAIVVSLMLGWGLAWIPLSFWPATSGVYWMTWSVLSFVLMLLGVWRPMRGIVEWLNASWIRNPWYWATPLLLLVATLATIVIVRAPFIGHADYADNAIVARNLVQGRGWVVDYISQFYTIRDGVTRPQETWPLLQPVWMALVFAIAGVSDVTARVPNVVFMVALAVLTVVVGRRIWDVRVGIFAMLLTVINTFVYRQLVFTTTDLAFMFFQMGAIYAVWRMRAPIPDEPFPSRWQHPAVRAIMAAVWTGLMLWQKPGSGGMIAIGLGIWLLYEHRSLPVALGTRMTNVGRTLWVFGQRLWPVVVWALVALLIVSPYVERNMRLFGSPAHTTEQYDAWLLEYTDWDAIYRVYAADGGLGSGDLPDRSWVLRWGYDTLLLKIDRQLIAIKDYLLPSLTRFPPPLQDWGSDAAALGMLADVGLWMMIVGLLVWRTPSVTLLLRTIVFATTPYLLFMVTYWHANEPRYWVGLIPWMALLAAAGALRVFDRMRTWYAGRSAVPALVLLCVLLGAAMLPAVQYAQERQQVERDRVAADLDMYRFLRANTPLSAVMMTRVPWQLQWYAERPAVMIPADADAQTLLRIARHYQVRYLVLDALQRPNEQTRAMIGDMLANPDYGFRELYRTVEYEVREDGRRYTMQSVVYEFPTDYAGVAPIR